MSCSNCPPEACYNGCVEIVSDQCVRYTGLDSVPLDITSGDSVQLVIENIIDNLVPLLSGTGDKITIASAIRCAIVNGYLPTPVDTDQWTSEQLFQTLVKVVCDLQTQITAIDVDIATLNADYTIDCLTGVTASSNTHDIVQAIINKLCTTVADLAALELDVATNYVKLSDLDALIAAYIASSSGGSSNQQYLKMVPYVAYEYYGTLANFDGSGIGIPDNGFFKVYLCNGLNSTPDKRGRVGVGAVDGVPGGPLDAAVDPTTSGNPNYGLYSTEGTNTVALITSQLPAHSHLALANTVVTLNDPGHTHAIGQSGVTGGGGTIAVGNTSPKDIQAVTSTTGITVDSANTSVTIESTGSGSAHANIQPVIAAYYIMYIP
jgi:microcystin-dependent protein